MTISGKVFWIAKSEGLVLNSLSGDSDFFLPHVVKGVQWRAFRTNLSKAVRTILTTGGSNFTIHLRQIYMGLQIIVMVFIKQK